MRTTNYRVPMGSLDHEAMGDRLVPNAHLCPKRLINCEGRRRATVDQDGAAGGRNVNMMSVLALHFRPSRKIKPSPNSRLRSRLRVRGPVPA